MLKTIDIPNKNPAIKSRPLFEGKNLSITKAMARDNTPIFRANL